MREFQGCAKAEKFQPPQSLSVASPVHPCQCGLRFSSLHPSQTSFFLGHSLFRERGCAGGRAWVPLPPGARGPPCGLAVAASLLCLVPQAKPQGPPLWMHQLLQDSQPLWAQILSHPGFRSQLCHLLAVRFEISRFPVWCLLSLSVEWRPEHRLPRTQRRSYCSS